MPIMDVRHSACICVLQDISAQKVLKYHQHLGSFDTESVFAPNHFALEHPHKPQTGERPGWSYGSKRNDISSEEEQRNNRGVAGKTQRKNATLTSAQQVHVVQIEREAASQLMVVAQYEMSCCKHTRQLN